MERKTVTDIVGGTYQEWALNEDVVFDCQTGSGKTYFLTHILHEYAQQEGKAILYLYNRNAVGNQQKMELLKSITQQSFSAEELKKISWIGNMNIVSYQKLAKLIRNYEFKVSWSKYSYIVFDECHFFVADSEFNRDIMFLLEQMPVTMSTIRIWVSATIDITKKFFLKKWDLCVVEDGDYKLLREGENYVWNREIPEGFLNPELSFYKNYVATPLVGIQERRIWYYENVRDYSYIKKIEVIETLEDVVKSIESTKEGEKSVVFVSTKKIGKQIEQKLKRKLAKNIDAEKVHKEPGIIEGILKDAYFKEDVLISTKILDNGVNLEDESLCHIFIIGIIAKEDFIQMLGRKRRGNEKVSLYLLDIKKEEIEGRLFKEREKMEVCNFSEEELMEEITNPRWNHVISKVWIYNKSKKQWILNEPLVVRTKEMVSFLEKCIERIEKEEITGLAQVMASWLGKELNVTYEKKPSKRELLENFLESCVEKVISKEEQGKFRESIQKLASVDIAKQIGGRSDRTWGLRFLNKYMETAKISYLIESVQDEKKTVWKVVKK